MKRLLAIDGGGIRGIIPARLCEEIERLSNGKIHEMFDLVAGTSTGALIAMGLTHPSRTLSAKDIVDFYRTEGPNIFSKPRNRVTTWWSPKYENTELERAIGAHLGHAKISQATTELLITSYDILRREPHYITRAQAKTGGHRDYFMSHVGMGTTAAPTYFPPYLLEDRVLIDGGLVANNPSFLALGEAYKLWPDERNFVLVSLGTGLLNEPIEYNAARSYGKVQWAKPALDCIFDGSSKATELYIDHYFLYHLKSGQYFRFQWGLNDITQDLDCAAPKSIAALDIISADLIRNSKSRMADLVDLLTTAGSETASAALSPQPELAREVEQTRALLQRIEKGVESSVSVKNHIFARGIRNRLKEIADEALEWQSKRIKVPGEDGGRFLVDLYEGAKLSVFSTRLKRFSGTFRGSSLPDDILEAHRRSKAAGEVTRVFVFDDPSDINGFDFHEMDRQLRAGIKVRVYFRPGRSPEVDDFTIIDEATIGLTKFISPRTAAGSWIFDEPEVIDSFLGKRRALLSNSVEYANGIPPQCNTRRQLWLSYALEDVGAFNIEEYQAVSARHFGAEAADNAKVLAIQRKAGAGIFVLQKKGIDKAAAAGIFCLIPLTLQGLRRLESGAATGATMSLDDIMDASEFQARAYYFGAIAGNDKKARAVAVDAFHSALRELKQNGVELVIARPVTKDGLRLLSENHWQDVESGGSPQLSKVCRIQLS